MGPQGDLDRLFAVGIGPDLDGLTTLNKHLLHQPVEEVLLFGSVTRRAGNREADPFHQPKYPRGVPGKYTRLVGSASKGVVTS